MLLSSLAASAHEFEVGGIYYYITSSTNLTVAVINKGSSYYEYSGSITIPTTVAHEGVNYSVTSIGERAFLDCSSLTFITIPEGVTSIGDGAFAGCSSLTSITIPEGVTSIGGAAFAECSSLTSITLPEGVTSIGSSAFYYCESLTSITLSKSVTSIGENAFAGCSSLESITIPENVTSIGSSAFYYCSNLTTINIPESVTSIGSSAFSGCSSLTSLSCNALTPPSIGDRSLGLDVNTPVYVPVTSLEAYKAAAGWSEYLNLQASDFSINYMVDGVVVKSERVAPGTALKPYIPTREGHTFSGWAWKTKTLFPIDLANHADDMLYTNAKCTNTQYGDQFVGWQVLFDKDAGTFFHSEYSNRDSDDGLDHYLRVDMGEEKSISEFAFTYTVRDPLPTNGNYTPKVIVVEGSNTAEGEYAEIATLRGLPSTVAAVYESPMLSDGNAYRYIRFRVTETYRNGKSHEHPYFFVAELGMSEYREVELELPTHMPNEDIVLTAQFEINSYNLNYVVDGQLYKTLPLEYGSVIVAEEAPEKDGYSFGGWNSWTSKVLSPIDLANHADDMLYTNAKCTSTQYGDQFKGWQVLFDNDASTIFHSEYSDMGSEDGLNHYLRVDMGEGKNISEFAFTYTTRSKNSDVNSPTTIVVEGCNVANGTYDEIAVLTELPTTNNTVYQSGVLGNGKAYRYIRFRVTATRSGQSVKGHPYFFIAEFGMSEYREVKIELPTHMPASDVTVSGGYVKLYKVYYLVNGKVVHTIEVPCGAAMPEYAYEPASANELFLGWEGTTYEAMPTHDVAYTAKIMKIDAGEEDDANKDNDEEKEEDNENGEDTGIINIPSQPVLIQCANGILTITGLTEGTEVKVYDTAGRQLGVATVTEGTATINPNLTSATTAIVKIGEHTVKVVIK